jgi:quercetin dioxygenase-like cupin family protein
MKVSHYEEIENQDVEMAGASGCKVRWLVDDHDGAPNFAMRQFEVAPGGFTPKHQHPYEHEVYVLEGTGVVVEGDIEHPLRPGQAIYVAPGELHQFRNTSDVPLRFLCMVPHSARARGQAVPPECEVTPQAKQPQP